MITCVHMHVRLRLQAADSQASWLSQLPVMIPVARLQAFGACQ